MRIKYEAYWRNMALFYYSCKKAYSQRKRSRWILEKYTHLGYNKASCALANKMAREIWAILSKGDDFVFVV